MPKLTLKAAVGYTRFTSDISEPGLHSDYLDYNVGVGLRLRQRPGAGRLRSQGANKQSAFNVVANPARHRRRHDRQTTYSPNKTRFIGVQR